ncbi:hypothetical protein BGZ51_001558, partial [Haplosporangium sp. Z 767]
MSDNPTEQEYFTLRALAEQAQNPNADAQQIMHHLHSNMEAMNIMQQQILSLQATVQDRSQAQSQNQESINGQTSAPITSLTAAIEALANQQRDHQQMLHNYQTNVQLVLERLSQRSHQSRAPIPPALSPKFKGEDGDMTFAEFRSKLYTQFLRFPESLSSDEERVNYALQSMEGPPA